MQTPAVPFEAVDLTPLNTKSTRHG
jgi:hypothetical protein